MKRREFLKSTGYFVCGVALADLMSLEKAMSAGKAGSKEFAWVKLTADNRTIIMHPAAEMGQGSFTSLAQMIAEELEVPWSSVSVEEAPVDPQVYGFSFRGRTRMIYAGSWTTRQYYTKLRLVGAQIRKTLVAQAAKNWKVPADRLEVSEGVISDPKTGKKISYGDLVKKGISTELVAVSESDLKPKKEFKIIGRSVPRLDIPSKSNGQARFSMDVHLPGMHYAMIVRSPVHNGEPDTIDQSKLPTSVLAYRLDHGVALVGPRIEDITQARNLIKISWRKADAQGLDSEVELSQYSEIFNGKMPHENQVLTEKGSVDKKVPGKSLQSIYFADYAYHAQMEPLNAVAEFKRGKLNIWVGTQAPDAVKDDVAAALKISTKNVIVHKMYLGGGFGRRTWTDYAVETAMVAKMARKPIKLIWTREDDLQYGAYRPQAAIRMHATVDKAGKLAKWGHCTAGEAGNLQRSGIDIPYYGVPNQKIELCLTKHGLRLKHWRAVGHNCNKFASECFIDEIASSLNQDPIAFRLGLMHAPEAARAKKVLERLAEVSEWNRKRPRGRALGVSLVDRSYSHGAGVAEISVDRKTGEIKVHKFWTVVDAGVVIHPDNTVAQLEGGVVWGISSSLKERVTIKEGKAEQSNYFDYNIARMADTPEIICDLIESDETPTGVGESTTPLVAPAIANAFFRLTGKRIRHMPMTPERVLAALNS